MRTIDEMRALVATSIDTDPSLAAYILRDTPEISAYGLRDLAWVMARNDSYCHKNDVLGLLEFLEERMNGAEWEKD